MSELITIGLLLGLSAGFAPGPLLTLVIHETLSHGTWAGVKVALSPLLTDLPIIVFSLLVLTHLSRFDHFLGVISLLGGVVVLAMGIKSMNPVVNEATEADSAPNSLARGALVNALSPHPYLFWFSVGGPILSKAMILSVLAPVVFLSSFYLLLIGSKVVLAVLVGKSRSFLKTPWYVLIMRVLGTALCVLACFLFRDGLTLLGIING